MEKKVAYKCKICLVEKDRKEFHYEQFESLNPKKICWNCEKKQYAEQVVNAAEIAFADKDRKIEELRAKIAKLEKINSIILPANKSSVPKHKHSSLNIWMEKGNKDKAWSLHKGQYRLYRTYPNKYIPNDSIIQYKKPDGSIKYYGLSNMHDWIFENNFVSSFS